jgi:putative Holliday junction resolvase
MRIMAIDYGDARTGVAISDMTGLLAGETRVIQSKKQDVVLSELTALVSQFGVTEIVLGYPKNMNGTIGPRAEKSEALSALLKEATGLPVILWDERRTTVDAHRILSETGNRGKRRKDKVDAVAATLILEGYLIRKRQGG